jgi:hypothetical protein
MSNFTPNSDQTPLDQLHSALEFLQSTNSDQQHQINSQQQVINELSSQVAALLRTQTPSPQSSTREPKMPDIPIFNGNRKSIKSFLVQLKNKFRAQPITFGDDQSRIAYLVSRLNDMALEWITPKLEENLSYSVIIHLLEQTFGDPQEAQNARAKLVTLKQADKSCSWYVTEFTRLAQLCNLSSAEYLGLFEIGLNSQVRVALALVEPTSDFETFVKTAIRVDKAQHDRRENGKSQHSNHSRPQRADAMEIDAIQTDGKKFTKLDEAEKNRRALKGLCAYCGENHKLENCSKRPKNGQSLRK